MTTTGSTAGATTQAGEPRPCGNIGRSVWYKVVPDANGTLTASTAGSRFDTVLTVYRGTALNALTNLGCNDDYASTRQSQVSASVTAGQTYYVQLGGYRSASGNFTLKVSLGAGTASVTPVEQPPAEKRRQQQQQQQRQQQNFEG